MLHICETAIILNNFNMAIFTSFDNSLLQSHAKTFHIIMHMF